MDQDESSASEVEAQPREDEAHESGDEAQIKMGSDPSKTFYD